MQMLTTLHADHSQKGAGFIGRRAASNPRQVFLKVSEANPHASKDDLFLKYQEEIRADEMLVCAIEWYSFVNMYQYESRNRRQPRDVVARRKQAMHSQIQKLQQDTEIVLMRMMTPCGKELGECKGKELAEYRGFLGRVARKVKPNQTIGKVLTEADLRALR